MENEERESLLNDIANSEKFITHLQSIINHQQNVIESYNTINKEHQNFSETTIHSLIKSGDGRSKYFTAATSVCLNQINYFFIFKFQFFRGIAENSSSNFDKGIFLKTF